MTADKEQIQASDHAGEQGDDAEQPEVEGYSAEAVERLRRFIAADEAHGHSRRVESAEETGQRASRRTDEADQDLLGRA